MAKKSKGFGTSTSPGNPKKSHQNHKSRRRRPIQKAVALAPLFDIEFLEDKEQRLQDMLQQKQVPEVNVKSLVQMHQALNEALTRPLLLIGCEPLDWEIDYVYGLGTRIEHQQLRAQYPSYLDRFQLQGLSTVISMKTGLQVQVERDSDGQEFSLPLIKVEALQKETRAYQAIADYHLWWSEYQPTYP